MKFLESEEKLRNIVAEIKNKYKNNLAAILVVGSYFIGNFTQDSDIDIIILIKKINSLNLKEEAIKFLKEFSEYRLDVKGFSVINDYEDEMYEKGRWTRWITVLKGSLIVYSSKEFEKFRERIKNKPLEKEKVMEMIIEKDEFDLQEYLNKAQGFKKTVCLFGHLRRKLQILSYYSGNELEFNYEACLKNISNLFSRKELDKLKMLNFEHKKRKILNEKEIEDYVSLSRKITPIVEKILIN